MSSTLNDHLMSVCMLLIRVIRSWRVGLRVGGCLWAGESRSRELEQELEGIDYERFVFGLCETPLPNFLEMDLG